MKSLELNLLELAAIHDALCDRIELLQSQPNLETDVKIRGEYEVSKSAKEKIKALYLSGGGPEKSLK